MDSFRALALMFVDPQRGFSQVSVAPLRLVILPGMLLLVGTSMLFVYYYQAVNISWLQDILSQGTDPDHRDIVKHALTRNMLQASSVVGFLVTAPIVDAILALYFLLVSKTIGVPTGYARWFAFTVWSSAPALLLIPLGAAAILLSDNGQLAPSDLNLTTLNLLLFHLRAGSPWKTYLDSISMLSIWSMALTVIGFRVWTGQPLGRSILWSVGPYLLLYGVWAAVIIASGAA